MEDHSDQEPLIAALDDWFEILRRRLKAPCPLKPAKASELSRFSSELGLELPPDVVALYEYTNGAWRDKDTPLGDFVPTLGIFAPVGSPRKRTFSITMEFDDTSRVGTGFDDLPTDDWLLNVPVIDFIGDQLSVMTADSCFQAVGLFLDGGMALSWRARRLADFFGNVLELEERGLLDWSSGSPVIDQSIGGDFPIDPDLAGEPPRWRWEPIPNAPPRREPKDEAPFYP